MSEVKKFSKKENFSKDVLSEEEKKRLIGLLMPTQRSILKKLFKTPEESVGVLDKLAEIAEQIIELCFLCSNGETLTRVDYDPANNPMIDQYIDQYMPDNEIYDELLSSEDGVFMTILVFGEGTDTIYHYAIKFFDPSKTVIVRLVISLKGISPIQL
jgi:hypothetical protein